MNKQTIYTTDAQYFSEIELRLQKLVERGYIEKKQGVYVLTQEQLDKERSDAFDAGSDYGIDVYSSSYHGEDRDLDYPTKEQYISSLTKQL